MKLFCQFISLPGISKVRLSFARMYTAYKQSQSPLVSAKWLSEAKKNELPNLVVLDVSIPMPGEKRDCFGEFKDKHIPGARFFSLAECVTKETDNAYMLPTAEKFAEFMCTLGVANNSKVVVYDANEKKGMFSSPRAWYMFKVFGHQDVSILDGGLLQWTKEGYETETGEAKAAESTKYDATYNGSLVKSLDDVKNNIESKDWLVIDARSEGRFNGKAPEPRPNIKPGHITGSTCLFWTKFLDDDKKVYRSAEELAQIYKDAGIDVSKPHVATCGTGVTACFLVLTSHILGHTDVPVYDGAWFDWYQHAPDNLKEDVPSD